MSETLVLSVGLDPLTLYSREAVLRSAGYIVVSALSIKDAFHLFQNGDFDLIVLCHTVPVRDRDRLIWLIRQSGSRIPVASILGTPGKETVFSDAALDQNPVKLLPGIRRLLADQFKRSIVSPVTSELRYDNKAHRSQMRNLRNHLTAANFRAHAQRRSVSN